MNWKLTHLVLYCQGGQWSTWIRQLPLSPCAWRYACEGVQGSAACDKNFARYSSPCVMACRGVSLVPWKIYLLFWGPWLVGGYIMGPIGPSGGGCNRNFFRCSPLFSRLWTWYSCHQLLLDIILWYNGGNCWPPPTSIPFYSLHYSAKERQETCLVLRQPPL